jgi:hypothetical protein
MGTYTQVRSLLPNGLDEIGLDLGLQRIDGESLSNYRRRLLLESRDHGGPSEQNVIRGINRKVGEFDIPVFEITLVRDVNNEPIAADPYIEVTSTFLRAYNDWTGEELDFELNLVERDDAYFLREVKTAFDASTYFDLEVIDDDYEFKRSDHLRFDNTERHVIAEILRNSVENDLEFELLRDIYPQAFQLFENEVAGLASVTEAGDFFVDYTNGVVYTFEVQGGLISYSYKLFPYTLYWQLIRAWPYNDPDKVFLLKDTLINDVGLEDQLVLNPEGARLANEVIAVHPLGWGE